MCGNNSACWKARPTRAIGQVLTVVHDVAGGRAIDTVDAIKQGCLARSVWANDRQQFAIVGLEADTVECGKAAEL
jgi:hypothetical protein